MGSRKYFSLPPHFPLLYPVVLKYFHLLIQLVVRHLKMLFTCGSQGPVILHGNWEAEGSPSSLP
jgi:hypothetical protein